MSQELPQKEIAVADRSQRRVIVQELVSADGFVADTSGELDFFEAVSDYREVDQENLLMLGGVDTILLGAATYRTFVEYWPTADDELVAFLVNAIPKTVFSSTLDEAPWGEHRPATVHSGSAVDHVRDLRGQTGGNIMLWGSISVVQSLLAAGLVDEVQLRVIPVALGAGRSLFAANGGPYQLALADATAFESGIVSLRYEVART